MRSAEPGRSSDARQGAYRPTPADAPVSQRERGPSAVSVLSRAEGSGWRFWEETTACRSRDNQVSTGVKPDFNGRSVSSNTIVTAVCSPNVNKHIVEFTSYRGVQPVSIFRPFRPVSGISRGDRFAKASMGAICDIFSPVVLAEPNPG